MLTKIQVFFSEKITLSKNKKKNLIFLRQFINNKKSEKIFFCCNSKTSRIRFENFLRSLELVILHLITIIILMTISSA